MSGTCVFGAPSGAMKRLMLPNNDGIVAPYHNSLSSTSLNGNFGKRSMQRNYLRGDHGECS